jgi:hypothetical protein
MTGTPEVPQPMPDASQTPAIQEVPTAPEISAEVSAIGVEPTGSAAPPPAPVVVDPGVQVATPVPTNVTTLTVPANQQQLLDWAKGDPSNSLTWLAKFWIRRIKQAVKHHWNLIMPPPTVQPVQQVGQSIMQQSAQTPIQQVQGVQPVTDPQGQVTQTQQVQLQDNVKMFN